METLNEVPSREIYENWVRHGWRRDLNAGDGWQLAVLYRAAANLIKPQKWFRRQRIYMTLVMLQLCPVYKFRPPGGAGQRDRPARWL